MLRLGDAVADTTTTTGTGAVTVSGTAASGYRTFSAIPGIAVGDTLFYAIRHQTAAEWETGLGTYSAANQITRTTVFESSNSNAVVTLSAGTKDVICSMLARAWRYAAVEPPQGRLTLTSATPVLTAAVAAATTVYYTPYQGRLVPVYDGTDFVMLNTAELSNVLANSATGNAGPAAGAAASVYDFFVWDNAGTLALTRGPAWTSDTARSAGTALVRTNGIWLNNASITNGPAASRGTYVGTIRTDAGGATVSVNFGGSAVGGTAAWFGLWNAFNRAEGDFSVQDSTASWTYTSTTLRAADASATFRVTMVRGLDEESVAATYTSDVRTSATTVNGHIAIGLDSTSAIAARSGSASTAITADTTITAAYAGLPGLGVHFLSAIENASAATVTFFGNGYSYLAGVLRY